MKRTHCIAALGFVMTSLVIVAAQEDSAHKARKNSFSSADGTFHFEYPASLVRCGRDPNQPDRWGHKGYQQKCWQPFPFALFNSSPVAFGLVEGHPSPNRAESVNFPLTAM
jgi:hypothetical protein